MLCAYMMCERPPAAARLSPFVRGTLQSPPYEGGRAAAGGWGSLTRHVTSIFLGTGERMKTSRRKFTQILGASIAAPIAPTTAIAGLWERAEIELQETGEVSADVVRILLDLQGPRGIYDDPKEFESLRAAVARAIPEHQAIRKFEVPMDTEPLLSFKRY